LETELDALAVVQASRAMADAVVVAQRGEADATGDRTELVNHEISKDSHTMVSGPSGKAAAGKKIKKGGKPKLTPKEKKERAVRRLPRIRFCRLNTNGVKFPALGRAGRACTSPGISWKRHCESSH
jgi:hypothetical protein